MDWSSIPAAVLKCIVDYVANGFAQRRIRLVNRHWNKVIVTMNRADQLTKIPFSELNFSQTNDQIDGDWIYERLPADENSVENRCESLNVKFRSREFPPDPSVGDFSFFLQSVSVSEIIFESFILRSFCIDLIDFSAVVTLRCFDCGCSSIVEPEWFRLAQRSINLQQFAIGFSLNQKSMAAISDRVLLQLASYGKLRYFTIAVAKASFLPDLKAETIRELIRNCPELRIFDFGIPDYWNQVNLEPIPERYSAAEIAEFLALWFAHLNTHRERRRFNWFRLRLDTADASKEMLELFLDRSICRRLKVQFYHTARNCEWVVQDPAALLDS